MKKFSVLLTVGAIVTMFAAEPSQMAKNMLAKAAPKSITYKDANGVLYSRNELQHLAKGDIAKGKVTSVSECRRKANAAVIPALKAFNDGLKALNIQLIVLPIPPKAAVMPPAGMKPGEAMKYLKPFYDELRAKNIAVLDLSDIYLKSGKDLYCRTDAHWSPAGMAVAAKEIAKLIKFRGNQKFTATPSQAVVSGDLAKSLAPAKPETETVKLLTVSGKTIDENSPVLLMGDSHTLIFSTGGDMLAKNSGFAEQLAAELKTPIDRIGVYGSASTVVRVNLFRKAAKNPQWLKNKKVVIYCFTCREFTESSAGWARVPVMRKR